MPRLLLLGMGLLAAPAALANSGVAPEVNGGELPGRIEISARARDPSVSLIITTEALQARKPRSMSAGGGPIGWDAEWREVPKDTIVFRAFKLTVNGRTRTIPRRLTDRFVHPGLSGVMTALSSDARNLFVCMYLGDAAGAAIALWSLSLGNDRDWVRAGDLISEWESPTINSGEECRGAGEAAPKIRAAGRRWPITMR